MIDIETYRQETDALFSKMHELMAQSDERMNNEFRPLIEKERIHQIKAIMATVAAVTVAALAHPVAGIALCAMSLNETRKFLKYQREAFKLLDEISAHNRDEILTQENNWSTVNTD